MIDYECLFPDKVYKYEKEENTSHNRVENNKVLSTGCLRELQYILIRFIINT